VSTFLSFCSRFKGDKADRVLRYDDFATPSAVSALEQFRWCMRDGCKSGQEHLLGGGQVFECNACGHQQRVTHNRPWHDGESCHEFDLRTNPEARRQAKDQASEEKIWETTQQCPACRVNIEKNQGCSHMTCKSTLILCFVTVQTLC